MKILPAYSKRKGSSTGSTRSRSYQSRQEKDRDSHGAGFEAYENAVWDSEKYADKEWVRVDDGTILSTAWTATNTVHSRSSGDWWSLTYEPDGQTKRSDAHLLYIEPGRDQGAITITQPLSFDAHVLRNRMWYREIPSELEDFFKQCASDSASRVGSGRPYLTCRCERSMWTSQRRW
jgi:hypothetical protein